MATLERNRGKTWDQIEPEARRLWAEKHDRPWDGFAVIVRQAWTQVSAQFADETAAQPKPQETYEAIFRRHYQTTFTESGLSYRQYALAYHLGYDLAVDRRLRDKSWTEIEPVAYQYWNRQRYAGDWEQLKEAARYAWNQVRGEINATSG